MFSCFAGGIGMDEEKARKPRRRRFTADRRERFLEVLAQTGNRGLAAEAIGVEPRLMDQRRGYDPLLDRQWREAVAAAERRLAGVEEAYEEVAGEMLVVWRGPNGRRQLRKPGAKRWSRAVEDRFFATLAVFGNIGASARAVGFSQSCIDQRRRKYPDFARRLEEALDDAEVEIEFRVAAEVRGAVAAKEADRPEDRPSPQPWDAAEAASGGSSQASHPASGRGGFDMDAAMRFLKWREGKRLGRSKVGRNGRVPKAPDIGAVTERIVRQVQAIKRQRGRGAS
jgi:hypothetical protein